MTTRTVYYTTAEQFNRMNKR